MLSVRVAKIPLREDNEPVSVSEFEGDLPPPVTITPFVEVTFNKPLLSFNVMVKFEVGNANESVIVTPLISEDAPIEIVFEIVDIEG